MGRLALALAILVLSGGVTGVATAAVGDAPVRESHAADPGDHRDSTIATTVNTSSSGLHIRANTSMLTTSFRRGSVLRIVADGTAFGERVVRFDVGLAYVGGPLLADPADALEVRSELSVSVPGFG